MPKIEISTFIAMSLFIGGLLFYQLHLYERKPKLAPISTPSRQWPIAEPKPMTAPRPVVQPVAKPKLMDVQEPIAKPVADPKPTAVPEPLAEPVAISQPMDVPKPAVKSKSVTKSKPKAEPKPIVEPKPIAKSEEVTEPNNNQPEENPDQNQNAKSHNANDFFKKLVKDIKEKGGEAPCTQAERSMNQC